MERMFYIYNPPGIPDVKLLKETGAAGAVGVYDLEFLDKKEIRSGIEELGKTEYDFAIRIDPLSDKLMALMSGEIPSNLKIIITTPKEGLPDMVRSGVYDTAHSMGLKVYQEVCTLDEAQSSIGSGADGLVLRGSEGSGRVSIMSTADILSICAKVGKGGPIIVKGDVSIGTIGSLESAGATGFVLDSQVYTLPESPLGKRIKETIRNGGKSTYLMDSIGRPFSVLAGTKASVEMAEIEGRLHDENLPQKEIYKQLKAEAADRAAGAFRSDDPDGGLIIVGSSGKYAKEMEGLGDLKAVIKKLNEVNEVKTADKPSLEKVRDRKPAGLPQKKTGDVTVDGKRVPSDYYDNAVAIVGMGAVFPKGIGVDNYWKMIINGIDAMGIVPEERWNWKVHYDPDPKAEDKTYSKIGAFLWDFKFDPFDYKIPPKVADKIDRFQRYVIVGTHEALIDSKLLDNQEVDRTRIATIVANSGGGENRDYAAMRVGHSDVEEFCRQSEVWKELPDGIRDRLMPQVKKLLTADMIDINEDSMPGSLPNVAAGRLANMFNFMGPNYITDAACASTLAALSSSRDQLLLDRADIAVTGGTDSLMAAQAFVEFAKIGALTPDKSQPFSDGANGFMMGEGCGMFILKRVVDAVRDGDKIYAVVKGIGGSSDGKGKGITAPSPKGQALAITKAMEDAGVDKSTISFIEAHGTSTAVGDVAEANSLIDIFKGLPRNSIGLTSVKSQIGHLKAAAGAAGLAKAALAVHHKTLPPQINFEKPNHYVDWDQGPFYIITEPKEWERIAPDVPRRCGISAFGFGGTNFHVILEEFDMDIFDEYKRRKAEAESTVKMVQAKEQTFTPPVPDDLVERKVDMEGIGSYLSRKGNLEGEVFLFSSDNPMDLLKQAEETSKRVTEHCAGGGRMRDLLSVPRPEPRYRLSVVVDDPEHFHKQLEMIKRVGLDEKGLMALAVKGIFVGDKERIDHGKTCFMFPGQGSQYINMLKDLKEKYRIVSDTFKEADRVMKDLIPNPLSSYVYVDVEVGTDEFKEASETLRQTEYNQPSMLTADTSIYKMLLAYGMKPDLVMGHSLGEYAALIASGIMNFDDALKAVSARGREMRDLPIDDPGKMASVSAGYKEVEEILEGVEGYVIAANKNCHVQTVIAGNGKAVDDAIEKFKEKGIEAFLIPVSHAFHSGVVAPVKGILRNYLSKLEINPPKIPILSNVTADYYTMEGDPTEIKEEVLDLLKEQVASSVEWMSQVERAYNDGCRTFIEVGPKRALASFAYNILEDHVKKREAFPVLSNHPKKGGIRTFNEMMGTLWSLGYDLRLPPLDDESFYQSDFIHAYDKYIVEYRKEPAGSPLESTVPITGGTIEASPGSSTSFSNFIRENQSAIGRFLSEIHSNLPASSLIEEEREDVDFSGSGITRPTRKGVPVVISGAAFGLPGRFKKVFTDENLDLLIEGRNLIETIDDDFTHKFIDKNIIRVDKKPDGSAEMIKLDDGSKVAHLAGMLGEFDLLEEFGVSENLVKVLDTTSKLAFASGLLALRDAGIPLVKRYAQTSTGSFLPEEWELPIEMQEDTGIIFASAFPGFDNLFKELVSYYTSKISSARGEEREALYGRLKEKVKGSDLERDLDNWYEEASKNPDEKYQIPRLFMFKILAMGHTQFAQYIKAKGPNTQVNSACASTTQAISLAQDWIQAGRCKRVLVLGADDPASEANLEWFGSGMLSLGALTNEKEVTKSALPFDRRRKGMILGSGAAALVVEAEEEPRRRGMNPIVEILGSHIGNSAFHGSRLDVAHISRSMERFMTQVEKEKGINRDEIAPDLLFMSHETYTPARGGSSAAEVESLRRTFGEKFREIIILNTKGYTGHAFGACLEDPVLIKCMEKGVAIPIANLTPEEIDPQFEGMQLSRGGKHDRRFGLRLAAGFGSQLAFLLLKRSDSTERYFSKEIYENWLDSIATTKPSELEVSQNVLRLKDQGRDNLIRHRAIRRGSSVIGYEREEYKDVDPQEFEMIRTRLIKIFSDKTGIPVEEIDIDADLDSELGIDSVKQVELFGSARIFFDLPKDEGVNLKEYPTLRHIIQYIILNKGRMVVKEEAGAQEIPESKSEDEKKPAEEAAGSRWDNVKDRILSVVAEKTGYPEDMLDLDLDLEADLGIDTVKQVELFALAREEYDLPKDEGINLSDFPTLRHIIDYVMEKSPATAEAPAESVDMTAADEPSPAASKMEDISDWDGIKERILKVVAEKTGYPEDMLELDLDLEADLGIDTVKQVELFAMAREEYDLPKDEGINLSDFPTLRHIIDYVAKSSKGPLKGPSPATAGREADKVESTAPASEEAAGSDWDLIKDKILKAVSEKTGYPEDMLELDLDLEADLGIDTVKQVELFAMAREEFDLPKDDSVNLSEFPTLRHIIDYVADSSITIEPKFPVKEKVEPEAQRERISVTTSEAPAESKDAHWEMIRGKIISVVADKTGYPEDMLELDLDLEADLGVDTVKQVELFAMAREEFDLPKDDSVNLSEFPTLRHIIDYVAKLSLPTVPESTKVKGPEAETAETAAEGPLGEGHPHWESIKQKIIMVVADKTGYPEDMLELDLDLEADLGVDTVKQVELFSMAREEFDLPKDDSVNLSEFPTLRHIIDYVAERSHKPVDLPRIEPEVETAVSVDRLKERINRWVLQADVVEDVPFATTKPLEGKKVILMGGGKSGVKAAGQFLGADIVYADPKDVLTDKIDLSDVDGLVNIYPLTLDADPSIGNWKKESENAVKTLFKLGKGLGDRLKNEGIFISATSMGGRFGLDRDVNPVNGAVSGFTKAVKREYGKATVMSIDLPQKVDIDDAMKRIASEISHAETPLEIGWDGKDRISPALRIVEPAAPRIMKIDDDMRILVSGGGTGITAEIVKEISRQAKVDLHLLGRTEILQDVERLAGLDDNSLEAEKERLKEEIKARGEKVTPVLLNKEFSKIQKSIAIHNLIKDIETAGSSVTYHSLDVKDEKGIREVVKSAGPIDGIIHAAGVEISKLMANKSPEEFDMVYDTKVDGARALINATRKDPLKFFIAFSSVAGRFGNGGQVDYSAANDFLNKIHGAVRKYHENCLVKAVGWSAWADVGMASRGSVKTILEIGGVTFIPVNDGIAYAIDEIRNGREKEILYSGSLGPMDRENLLKWEDGITKPVFEPEKGPAPLLDEIVSRDDNRLVAKRTLDGIRERFLPDHSIMGKMVLPGVMGMEIFAETASILVPDLEYTGIQDMYFHRAVNVDDPKEVLIEAEVVERKRASALVTIRLTSTVMRGGKEVVDEHYTGTVRMGKVKRSRKKYEGHPLKPRDVRARVLRDELYRHLFHGDVFRVLEGMDVLDDGEFMGIYHPVPDLFDPSTAVGNDDLTSIPMQTEAGFQVAGAYVLDKFKLMALPVKVGSMTINRWMSPSERGFAWVKFKGEEENTYSFDVTVLDADGNISMSYQDYRLKALMAYDKELKEDNSIRYEEIPSNSDGVRVFRVDIDKMPKDLLVYRSCFSDEEWSGIDGGKMTKKRKREHIAGRIAAKGGLSWFLSTERGEVLSSSDIVIESDELGKPHAAVNGERLEISISHSHRWAVCSVACVPHGVDIELSEPRDPAFQDEAFTDNEKGRMKKWQKSLKVSQDELVTLIFSAKEAFLKMKGLGLREDLKKVEASDISEFPKKTAGRYKITIEMDKLKVPVFSEILGAYVLSVCKGREVN
ncbi:MAG: SDR family NAD(P)-dependent oxidoreductase [Thermoplasmatota archaeon]